MRPLLLCCLLACGAPAPPPPAAPTVEALAGWLGEAGLPPERHGDILRSVVTAPWGPLGLTAQVDAEHQLVLLATQGLLTLDVAPDPPHLVLLVTNLATINYELPQGKLQLNAETGEIVLSIELETDEGLGRPTFTRAVTRLQAVATQVRPRLVQAATP
ncbi:MAG: YbjN domain-containing protein [Alphaproteobacteria bacterium]|nr:YbjN domain-containing protein [Alphaproteobacteria bacterium]